jgi:hypothetical protein
LIVEILPNSIQEKTPIQRRERGGGEEKEKGRNNKREEQCPTKTQHPKCTNGD